MQIFKIMEIQWLKKVNDWFQKLYHIKVVRSNYLLKYSILVTRCSRIDMYVVTFIIFWGVKSCLHCVIRVYCTRLFILKTIFTLHVNWFLKIPTLFYFLNPLFNLSVTYATQPVYMECSFLEKENQPPPHFSLKQISTYPHC